MANTGHAAKVDAAIAADAKRSGQVFTRDISAWVEKTNGDIDATLRRIVITLGAKIADRTPHDTGAAIANWRASAGKVDGTATDVNGEIDKNTALGIAGSRTIEEAGKWDARKDRSFFITNVLPYIKRLEYGWSVKQAPHGMVRTTAAEFLGSVREAVTFTRRGGS